ncbi:HipA family kinase [Caballeronia sp. ATUFL_F1_KS4A]|uniref:HipA family kinase n=1 Tax=Caballeronia sp. ATUFL_F1_KS4A TaxID=2921768 RepID=UPI0020289C40|nr:HipA family kinase [Caballeronia sp. ATUFL_F1_KS4A]
MLQTVLAARFVKAMGNGRTRPVLLECEDAHGNIVEMVTKCSSGTMEGVRNLAIEAVAALLGRDIGLPVPSPYVVQLEQDFINSVADAEIRRMLSTSCRFAFGSECLPGGFAVWPRGGTVEAAHCQLAAEIFVFDGIIVNSDRRPENPNCLTQGNAFAIFDHELTMRPDQVLFWKAPWLSGGFDQMHGPNLHIFSRPYLEQSPQDLNRFIAAWNDLSRERLASYVEALPGEWRPDDQFLDGVVDHLDAARTNIAAVVQTALGVLQ